MLGCAPQVIARVRPRQELRAAPQRRLPPMEVRGRMDRRSELASGAAARAPRGFHVDSTLRIEPNPPDGCRLQTRNRPRGCSQKDLVLGELRSLTRIRHNCLIILPEHPRPIDRVFCAQPPDYAELPKQFVWTNRQEAESRRVSFFSLRSAGFGCLDRSAVRHARAMAPLRRLGAAERF